MRTRSSPFSLACATARDSASGLGKRVARSSRAVTSCWVFSVLATDVSRTDTSCAFDPRRSTTSGHTLVSTGTTFGLPVFAIANRMMGLRIMLGRTSPLASSQRSCASARSASVHVVMLFSMNSSTSLVRAARKARRNISSVPSSLAWHATTRTHAESTAWLATASSPSSQAVSISRQRVAIASPCSWRPSTEIAMLRTSSAPASSSCRRSHPWWSNMGCATWQRRDEAAAKLATSSRGTTDMRKSERFSTSMRAMQYSVSPASERARRSRSAGGWIPAPVRAKASDTRAIFVSGLRLAMSAGDEYRGMVAWSYTTRASSVHPSLAATGRAGS
mmetsp:Transcript_11545/g.36678  ORF Transcript_11545/g.36678 Transcript_11545/m.36678 type:complete len:333 (+) Transcript_11545:617-1615(+)